MSLRFLFQRSDFFRPGKKRHPSTKFLFDFSLSTVRRDGPNIIRISHFLVKREIKIFSHFYLLFFQEVNRDGCGSFRLPLAGPGWDDPESGLDFGPPRRRRENLRPAPEGCFAPGLLL
jgi:hypothetical protein